MIYHYCNQDVFEKITETKIIWLSDITKMNDESEYKNGFQIIRDILRDYSDIDQRIVTELGPGKINNGIKILIACFSNNGDLLSQWREYADDSKGFSIGFDLEMIKQHNMFNRYFEKMEPISNKIEFMDVSYDLDAFIAEVHQLIKSCKDSKALLKYKLLARMFMHMSVRYKDSFFSEEREVRGYIAPEDNIKRDDFVIDYREGTYGNTAFHKLNTNFQNISAIKEIIIGPKSQSTIADIIQYLKPIGLENVSVKYSRGRGQYR